MTTIKMSQSTSPNQIHSAKNWTDYDVLHASSRLDKLTLKSPPLESENGLFQLAMVAEKCKPVEIPQRKKEKKKQGPVRPKKRVAKGPPTPKKNNILGESPQSIFCVQPNQSQSCPSPQRMELRNVQVVPMKIEEKKMSPMRNFPVSGPRKPRGVFPLAGNAFFGQFTIPVFLNNPIPMVVYPKMPVTHFPLPIMRYMCNPSTLVIEQLIIGKESCSGTKMNVLNVSWITKRMDNKYQAHIDLPFCFTKNAFEPKKLKEVFWLEEYDLSNEGIQEIASYVMWNWKYILPQSRNGIYNAILHMVCSFQKMKNSIIDKWSLPPRIKKFV